MFSRESVSYSVHGSEYSWSHVLWRWVYLVPGPLEGWVSLVPGPFWGWVGCPGAGYVQGVSMSRRGQYVRGRYSPPPPDIPTPPLLTPSGSHHTYSRQAGCTHPTRMLSCLKILFKHNRISCYFEYIKSSFVLDWKRKQKRHHFQSGSKRIQFTSHIVWGEKDQRKIFAFARCKWTL